MLRLEYFKNLKVITVSIGSIIGLLITVFGVNAALDDRYSKRFATIIEVEVERVKLASASDEIRKALIRIKMEGIEKRMWWLEGYYGPEVKDGNKGNKEQYQNLKKQLSCLEKALDDKDKHKGDCS